MKMYPRKSALQCFHSRLHQNDGTMVLQSLNDVALKWRIFLSNIPTEVVSNTGLHVPGGHSLYILTIDLVGDNTFQFFYVGTTARKNPMQRVAEHKCEIQRCRVTTFNSKSKMYEPRFVQGLQNIKLSFMIIEGGLTHDVAKEREKIVSDAFRRQHGEFVLTKPIGKRGVMLA